MQVGDLVRYKDNAFMGDTMPADYGVGIVLSVNANRLVTRPIEVVWHNAKTSYGHGKQCGNVRYTKDEKEVLIVVSGRE